MNFERISYIAQHPRATDTKDVILFICCQKEILGCLLEIAKYAHNDAMTWTDFRITGPLCAKPTGHK